MIVVLSREEMTKKINENFWEIIGCGMSVVTLYSPSAFNVYVPS